MTYPSPSGPRNPNGPGFDLPKRRAALLPAWLAVTLLLLLLTSLFAVRAAVPAATPLAADGRALLSVVISANASAETKAVATTLADYLGRISGAKFPVQTGDGAGGIVVGRWGDFPALQTGVKFDPADATRREEYLLRSHAKGVWLLGATDIAARHAVWDFLYRLGWRQFFPGKNWEVIPSTPALAVSVDALEKPAYHSRRITYGYGAWDDAKVPYREWCEKNRAVEGIELRTGHSYDGILLHNAAAFKAHPEYLGLVGGERKSTKFCISNPGLRQLAVDDAFAQLAKDPERQCISMDPSDGGGWCECDECKKIGNITDRALTLANTVAAAITAKFPDKFVGMYAYSQHSPPPHITAHPRVVISVATSFITGGFTVDQLLDGWSKRASLLGIREYYSVNTWDRDLPGAARGSRLDYLRQTIPHFAEKGARFLHSEASDNWAPNGLGYFVAARMLWDTGEAKRVEEITADFLEKCFGPARVPMAKFYALLDGSKHQPLSDDLAGRMYRLLDEARGLTRDAATLARLDDLTLYARYCELWLDYSIAEGVPRQAAFEALIRHAYRMRGTMMIHSLALYRDLRARDKSVTVPADAYWNIPEGNNPWKSSAPFTRDELDAMRRDGIANRKLLDFTPVAFSGELVPAVPLKLAAGKTGKMDLMSRAPRNYFTWIETAPAALALKVAAGLVYQNHGSTRVELFPAAEVEGKSIAHAEVPPTREDVPLEMKTTFTGLHRIEVIGGGSARTALQDGAAFTVESSYEHPGKFHGRWTLCFYVPRGTKIVGGFSHGPGTLRNASGAVVHTFEAKPGFFNVPVAPGEDGRLWTFEQCAGDKMLMTVPPYLARNAAELLLPREVVEKDVAR